MRKTITAAALAVLASAPLAAYAQSFSLTTFFGTSDLTPLTQTPTVLNLDAQSADGKAQTDVNAFDQFFAINGKGKLVVQFDRSLMNQGSVPLPMWIGVAAYSNHDIKSDIQAGWQAVQAKYGLKNGIGHMVVYKTINTSELIYDYASPLAPGSSTCQEYLYAPNGGAMQVGMRVGCTISLKSFPHAMKSSAGRRH